MADRTAHKARMAARKAHRRALTPGFTPMINHRIEGMIQRRAFVLMRDQKMDAPEAVREANRLVAASLPPLPMRRRHRAVRPSRSDNPAYCKPVLVKQRSDWTMAAA